LINHPIASLANGVVTGHISHMRVSQRPQQGRMHQPEFRDVNFEDRNVPNSIEYLRNMSRRSVLNFNEAHYLHDSLINFDDGSILRHLESCIGCLNTTHFHYQRADLRRARHNAVVAQAWISRLIISLGEHTSILLELGVQPMIDDIIAELDYLLSFLMP
jgi:hypothetical protein